MKHVKLFASVALLAFIAFVRADAPATQPAPDADEIKRLIGLLGDDDFKTREDVGNRLVKMGQAALPALREATKSEDPEIQARSEAAIRRIETGDKPEPEPKLVPPPRGRGDGPMIVGGIGGGMQMSVQSGPNGKEIDVKTNGSHVHITENPDGISVVSTEQKMVGNEMKEVTDEVKAKNAEELKKDHPEAFALYEKYAGGGPGARVQLQIGGGLNVGGAVAPIQPADIDQLIQRAEERLKNAATPRQQEMYQRQINSLKARKQQLQPQPEEQPKPDEVKPEAPAEK